MTLKTSDMAICAEAAQFTIRDYSNQGLLGPVPRSENGGYRSFDPLLIPQMYLIKTLRELGCTPQQIRDYGQSRTPEKVLEMFHAYSAQLTEEMAALQAKRDVLESRIALIEEGKRSNTDTIEVRTLPERPVRYSSLECSGNKARGREQLRWAIYSALECSDSKTKGYEQLRWAIGEIRQNGNVGCPLGYVYHGFNDILEKPDRPAQMVSFDPQGSEVRPAGEYLVGTVSCFYGQPNGLPHRMNAYALHNRLELCGPVYAIYLLDAASVTEPEQYLLQITVSVENDAQGC